MKSPYAKFLAVLGLLSMALAACGGDSDELDATVQFAIASTETAEAEFNATVQFAVDATNAAALGTIIPTSPPPPPPPTPVPPVAEVVAELAEANNLLIAKNGDDSMFVMNLSDVPIPMATLRLGDGGSALIGLAWGIDPLEPNSCVTTWKDRGNPVAPAGLNCVEVGERLTRDGANRFWRADFNVYFNSQQIGVCPGADEQCAFNLEF